MFLLRRNYAGFPHAANGGILKDNFSREIKSVNMISEAKEKTKNKGGRPKKNIRRDEQLAVMCTIIERKAVEHMAKLANISVSEYLRTVGLNGRVDMKKKTLPKEVLEFKGMLSHMAANLNQVAKKRNREEPFNDMERDAFMLLCNHIKEAIKQIENYLQ